jgi:alanyl-tRNA synthetase
LHQVVGSHATQKGSLVEPDRLRFDFSHIQALTADEVDRIERLVNEKVLENAPVEWTVVPMEKARQMGAMMLFGEKYGSEVRVVSVGEYSKELCGGTHARAAGDIGLVRIVSESSVAAGTRRIEAVTGLKSLEYIRERDGLLAAVSAELGGTVADVPARVEGLRNQIAELRREVQRLRRSGGANVLSELLTGARDVAGVRLVSGALEDADVEMLKEAADRLTEQLGSGVVVLGGVRDGKVSFVAKVSKDLAGRAHAGNLVREVARIAGGGGGGRPDFAQAGAKDPGKLNDALATVETALRAQLGE